MGTRGSQQGMVRTLHSDRSSPRKWYKNTGPQNSVENRRKKTKTYFSPLNNIIRYKHVLSALFVSHFTHSSGATIGSEMSSDFISPGTRGLAHHLLF